MNVNTQLKIHTTSDQFWGNVYWIDEDWIKIEEYFKELNGKSQ